MKDNFISPEKDLCRQRNLAHVKKVSELWSDSKTPSLRCRWCELMGDSGTMSLRMLVDSNSLRDDDFVGVDYDAARISRFESEYPRSKWISGNIYSKIHELEQLKVGVMNMDGYGGVGTTQSNGEISFLRPLIMSGLRNYSAFVLLWNKSLDGMKRCGKDLVASMRDHATSIAEMTTSLPSRISFDQLLPSGWEQLIADPGFTGPIGAFEIYKGSGRRQRMVNLRLTL